MDYDFSISEDVPLSRVLDQLINDNEAPEVIIGFLKLHDNDFKDIVTDSLCWTRIFQLDFIFECNDDYISYLVSKLPDIDHNIAMYLVWQICKTETQLPKLTKDKVRTFAFIRLSRANDSLRSPYAYSDGRYVEKAYDMRFFDACNRRCLVEEMCSMTDNGFKNYCDHIAGSLFKYRFFQYDVFSCLNDCQKFMMLRAAVNYDAKAERTPNFEHFIMQILDSSECAEVKYEANSYFDIFIHDSLEDDDYAKCSSFSELLLKMSINGEYDWRKVICHCLQYKRLDILKDWIEHDEASFNEAFNISDLVKFIVKLKDKKVA